jgi:hypothetical protein
MKCKLVNFSHIEFQQYMWKILWYTENSIYGVTQTKVYYGPVGLKIENDKQSGADISQGISAQSVK